jgi:hypothetical protein
LSCGDAAAARVVTAGCRAGLPSSRRAADGAHMSLGRRAAGAFDHRRLVWAPSAGGQKLVSCPGSTASLWMPESRSWLLSCEFVGEATGPCGRDSLSSG